MRCRAAKYFKRFFEDRVDVRVINKVSRGIIFPLLKVGFRRSVFLLLVGMRSEI